ncbi:hypothetical protein BCR34DRAFT_590047 [Clohesyomyces aquaticus]|uniref:SH3 domain-containing protein n=1 Tax=Clohesyomyces aquaticus TaxID=1231657 RepID=A0A1Y1ZDA5_9PLEO|nr:hypothetical protein BCR34DRAFT_590047 [Clohesyomyces aquaticus]
MKSFRMPTSVLPGNSSDESISGHYEQCLTLFRKLLAALNDKTKGYGRLRTWGEETRAALPKDSRGSLDDTLRGEASLKETSCRILARLNQQLTIATRVVENSYEALNDPHNTQIDGLENEEDAESSSEDDEDSEEESQFSKVPTLSAILMRLDENINSLYQVSLLISRPGFRRQYLHSTGEHPYDSRIAHYAEFDLRYIKEKFQDWNQQRQGMPWAMEPTTTCEVLEERTVAADDVHDNTKILARRFAKANTKRREQILYWSIRPDASHLNGKITDLPSPSPAVVLPLTVSVDEPSTNEEANIPIRQLDTESEGPKSTMTRKTFSTVVASDFFGAQTVTGPTRTIYAESTVGNKRSNRVPDLPRDAKKAPTFECPYCHTILESDKMQDRREWKRHVFRDLRPYLCTFVNCQNPDKQYLSRRDWIYHEKQMHRRRWVCEEHDASFSTEALFIIHVNDLHSTIVTEQQQLVLLQMSERQVDEMEIVACPLCPDERRLMILENHLADHLESMALFVLPSYVDDDDPNTSSRGMGGGESSRMWESVESTFRLPRYCQNCNIKTGSSDSNVCEKCGRLLTDTAPAQSLTRSISEGESAKYQEQHDISTEETRNKLEKDVVNIHRVQLDFKPTMQDEMKLQVDQLVFLLHEYDDGWALCRRMDGSQQGVVPRTCLSKQPVKPRNGPSEGAVAPPGESSRSIPSTKNDDNPTFDENHEDLRDRRAASRSPSLSDDHWAAETAAALMAAQLGQTSSQISGNENDGNSTSGEKREDKRVSNDRWDKIRKNAAERAARLSATKSGQSSSQIPGTEDDGDTSGEETIESRVARIKARVAELTGNMEGTERSK